MQADIAELGRRLAANAGRFGIQPSAAVREVLTGAQQIAAAAEEASGAATEAAAAARQQARGAQDLAVAIEEIASLADVLQIVGGLEIMGSPGDRADDGDVLTFRIAGERYALGVDEVSEIIRPRAITRVPHGPAALLGVTNLRGAVLPVVSLAGLLGGDAAGAGAGSHGSS